MGMMVMNLMVVVVPLLFSLWSVVRVHRPARRARGHRRGASPAPVARAPAVRCGVVSGVHDVYDVRCGVVSGVHDVYDVRCECGRRNGHRKSQEQKQRTSEA